jgi:hypothetical protein
MPEWRFKLQTLGLYIAMALVFYAPNLPTFSTASIGHYQGNGHKHVRGLWAGMESIAENGYVSSEVKLINYPDGGTLFSLEQGSQWLGMIFRPFMNVVAIHNILYILNTLLAAFAAMLLAREFTGSREGGVIAGAIYGFAPTALAFPIFSGVTETAYIFPFPLLLLFVLRSIYRKSYWNPILAALFLLLQGLTCWSYGIGAGVVLVMLFLILLAGRGQPWVEESRLLRGAKVDRALLARIGLFVLVLAAIALPLFLAAKSTVSGDNAVYSRPVSLWPGFNTLYGRSMSGLRLTLFSYITPGRSGLVVESWLDLLIYAPYAGFIALALAVVGVKWGPKGSWTLAIFAIIFVFLSLGPRIALTTAEDPPTVRNFIYAVFWYVFPVFHVGRHSPDRFSITFQLLLSLIAAGGLSVLVRSLGLSENRRWLIAAGVTLLIFVESVFVSPIPWPIATSPSEPHEVSLWLKDNGDPGAILDVPVYHPYTVMVRGDIFMQQVYHQRPIPYNYLDSAKSVSENGFYSRVVDEQFHHPKRSEIALSCSEAADLRELGFAYIVYRPKLNPHRNSEVNYTLTTCLQPPQIFGDVLLYSLKNIHEDRPLNPEILPPADTGGREHSAKPANPFED